MLNGNLYRNITCYSSIKHKHNVFSMSYSVHTDSTWSKNFRLHVTLDLLHVIKIIKVFVLGRLLQEREDVWHVGILVRSQLFKADIIILF